MIFQTKTLMDPSYSICQALSLITRVFQPEHEASKEVDHASPDKADKRVV